MTQPPLGKGSWYETYRSIIYPRDCDAQGHLNTAGYMATFDASIFQLMFALGYTMKHFDVDQIGWADVSHSITYFSELRAGMPVFVKSRVVRRGLTSLTTEHQLFHNGSDSPAAKLDAKTVQFDLKSRKSVPLLPELEAAAGPFA